MRSRNAERPSAIPDTQHVMTLFVLRANAQQYHDRRLRNRRSGTRVHSNMSQFEIPSFTYISLDRRDSIFIITLHRGQENRLNTTICNEIIKAFHYIQRTLGPDAEGAVITRGHDAKFWCTGVDQDERDTNPYANSDGFFPMIRTILDFPYPTVALLTGHTFGGACPFALSHDYRVMNSERGFISMVHNPLHIPSDRLLTKM